MKYIVRIMKYIFKVVGAKQMSNLFRSLARASGETEWYHYSFTVALCFPLNHSKT